MDERKIAEVFPPGEFIEEELEARGWSQIDLTDITGLAPAAISQLITGKRPISPEIAKIFANVFGTSAQFWMNLETTYRLSRTKDIDSTIARKARLYQIAPVKEMIKRRWLESSENIDVLEERIKKFFGITNLDDPLPLLAHAARKSTQEITSSHIAWLFRAKQLAPTIYAKPYSDKSFKNCLGHLKDLLHSTYEVRHVSKVLAEHGIRLIIVEHLPQTKIDGVTFWLGSSPVIAMSLRFDRIDGFWFTLAHELGHVKRKDGLSDIQTIIDVDLMGETAKGEEVKAELEANYFATEFLVGHNEINDFILRVAPLYSKQKLINFAESIKVHPGIVVGQLQYRNEVPWNTFRGMLDKIRAVIIPSCLTDGWGQVIPTLDKETSSGYKN